jgi:nucleoside-diphosphate-sugar epimerase
MTYGPGQDPRKIIPYVTTSLLEDKAPRLSNGALEADWIYIDDVIDGIIAMVDTPDLEGATMDLGSGHLTSVRSIVDHLLSLTGVDIEPLFGTLPDRPKEQVRIADIGQTALRLKWKPTVSLVQGLHQTVTWFKQQRIKGRAAACPV